MPKTHFSFNKKKTSKSMKPPKPLKIKIGQKWLGIVTESSGLCHWYVQGINLESQKVALRNKLYNSYVPIPTFLENFIHCPGFFEKRVVYKAPQKSLACIEDIDKVLQSSISPEDKLIEIHQIIKKNSD